MILGVCVTVYLVALVFCLAIAAAAKHGDKD